MKLITIKHLAVTLALCLAPAVYAGTFADNFSANQQYLSNGVAGTAWSGMTTGTNDGDHPCTIAAWDANITAPNTLTITNTGGNWDGANDGPFLWKLVAGSGDFTTTVHVSRMDQISYHFGGLLVRDPNVPGNWLYLGLFPEYSDETGVRDTANGYSAQIFNRGAGYVEADSSTWRSWLQIRRVGGVISTYASTDGVNWELTYESTRTDLAGDLQVGIFDSTYYYYQCSAQYQNFSIVGPGIFEATAPNQATGLTVAAQQEALGVSWTKGAGSDGSLVVVRKGNGITYQPLDGTTYTGNATVGAGMDLGESNYVAYVGAGTSVTLTNLITLTPYTVAVYAYAGAGAARVYTLANPPVASQSAIGTPIGIAITFGATNAVAVDDTMQVKVMELFTGNGQVEATGLATFSSGNTQLATITAAGLLSALSNGVVAISASCLGYNTTSNLTVVKLPVTDDFSVPRDYLTQGLPGTGWNGLLLDTNDLVLGEQFAGPTTVLLANAGITKAGRLTLSAHDSTFFGSQAAGVFLYRIIPGDFSISVQITSFDTPTYHEPGLMVRAPFETYYTENNIQLVSYNQYSIGNMVRRVYGNAQYEYDKLAQPAMPFLMIQRQANTFSFYRKAHALDEWILIASEDRPEFGGVAMQVGIEDETFTANTGTAEFDNLNIITPNAITNLAPLPASNLALTSTVLGAVTASWTPAAGSDGSIVVAHPIIPGTRQPADGSDYSATANADLALGIDLGGSNIVVYAGTGNSVVVSNLPSIHYSFAVYSYVNVGGTNYYNLYGQAPGGVDVLGVPTVNVQPPVSITRYLGANATISAAASPGSYRWQKGGVDVANSVRIAGATTGTLNINGLVAGDAGSYTFIVTNLVGSVTSSPAILSVAVPTKASELSVLAASPVGFWRLNETSGTTAHDYVGGFDGAYDPTAVLGVAGPRPADGFAHFEAGNTAVQFLGNGSASVVTLPALTAATELVSNLTITAWIKPDSYPSDRAAVVSFNAPANTGLRLYPGTTGLSILYNNTVYHTGMVPPLNQWSFVAMVIKPTGATFYLATNGGWQVYSDAIVRAAVSISGTCYIGSDRGIAGRYFSGVIDEAAVYKSALSGSIITNLFNGVVAPSVVNITIQKTATGLQLIWPQGTLLEATNLAGAWTTNAATSPYSINSPVGTKFFRVRVQ